MAATEPTDKASLDEEFAELYRSHLRDVYSYAYYRVGNHHDAEDLTEQTFLQAYRHFERRRRVRGPAAAAVAHPDRAQPGGELYRDRSRRPQTTIDDTGGLLRAVHTTEDLVEGRDELARILARCEETAGRSPRGADHALRAGMDNREIARALGQHRRGHEGPAAPCHQAARRIVEDERTTARS